MTRPASWLLLLILAGCGIDGPPERPGTGGALSGEVAAGVTLHR